MKGNQAKEQVTNAIVKALGDNFIKIQDKKIYTWADDGGERVQIAISMTMPKVQVEASDPVPNNDWTKDTELLSSPQPRTPVDISPEDKEAIAKLKKKLGIED